MKAVQGNPYKGFYDPLPNIDPYRELLFGSYDLSICRKCLQLYGRLVRILPTTSDGHRASAWRQQKCQCMKHKDRVNGIKYHIWPGNCFNISVEFCYCCGKRLINTGSRYSLLFCQTCLKIVREYNHYSPEFKIPKARHSHMIGLSLRSPFTQEDQDNFHRELDIFFMKLDLLSEWRNISVFENLHDLGFRFDANISIGNYDSLIKIGENDSAEKFKAMLEYMTGILKVAPLEKNSKTQIH
jgi:hypothetical protein